MTCPLCNSGIYVSASLFRTPSEIVTVECSSMECLWFQSLSRDDLKRAAVAAYKAAKIGKAVARMERPKADHAFADNGFDEDACDVVTGADELSLTRCGRPASHHVAPKVWRVVKKIAAMEAILGGEIEVGQVVVGLRRKLRASGSHLDLAIGRKSVGRRSGAAEALPVW